MRELKQRRLDVAHHARQFGSAGDVRIERRTQGVDRDVRGRIGRLRFNHAVHMKNDLRGPGGPEKLECAGCHKPEIVRVTAQSKRPPTTGLMAPITFKDELWTRAAVHIIDPVTGEYRESTLKDLYDIARLVDSLDHIHFFQRAIVCRDLLDPFELDVNTCYASVMGTSKHVGTSWVAPEQVDACLKFGNIRQKAMSGNANLEHILLKPASRCHPA